MDNIIQGAPASNDLAAIREHLQRHDARLADGDIAMQQIRDELARNTASTLKVEASTSEIVQFFASVRAAFRVLDWVGRVAKPVGSVVGLLVTLGAAWKLWITGGTLPPPPQK